MPNTRVLKPRPAEAKPPALKTPALKPPARADGTEHRGKRASSCPRCYHDNARGPVAAETRARAPKATSNTRGELKATDKTRAAATPRELKNAVTSRAAAGEASQSPPVSTHSRTRPDTHSHKAFTVFAPNAKKRQDIQRKAEAELAALEDLRLSRAMNYVCISPSAVGGRLTLEEVRTKQQQEMQIRRRQKQVKKYALETSAVPCG